MPTLIKKFVATIWNPMIGKQKKTMRMPSTERRISSSSEVNIPTAMRGMNSPRMNPAVVTHVAPIIVSFSTRITRSYCFAPKL